MRKKLLLHPDSQCAAVSGVGVEAARPRPGVLRLDYVVTGEIAGLVLPAVGASARADELWRRTCFEAFVRASADAGYYELNLAPSTEWAAYRFAGYRSGMRVADAIGAPAIEVECGAGRLALRATLELGGLAHLSGDLPWRVGLAAVIEESGGRKSYWALAHAPGPADFHHSDCFALELPPA